jgi:protein transport protein SEC24
MEYMARPPQPPVFLFLLDVSYHAVQAGVLPSAARIILDALDGLPNTHDRTKVGIMTVDSTVHFYRLALGEEEPRMLVLSDFEGEPFLPCPEDLLVSLTDGRAQLVRVLRKIATLFQETQCADSALGPALAAAVKLLSPMGGKLVVIQASLPTIGEGKIPASRNDPTALSTTKENALMQPANGFYKTLATECIRCQICIDLFLFPSPHIDVATIGCAAKYTGGKIFLYPEFSASNIESVEKLAGEMSDHLKADVGLEAVIRIRASQGVSLGSYHGSFFLRSTDLLALPNVNARHSYSAQVTIEENINSRLLCFQTAVLYTSCAGERRIRVINAAYPVTDDHREVVLHADCGALGDLLMKMAAEKALSSRLEDARDALLNKLHDILAAIRALFQTGQNPQLLLTENLRLLPLMILGILKSTAIRGSKAANSLDMRAYMLALVKTLSVSDSLYLLHPYLCAIHAMTDEV